MAARDDFEQVDPQQADSLRDPEDAKSSKLILDAIQHAENYFEPYFKYCDVVDKFYNSVSMLQYSREFEDNEFDLFWASMDIVKPAIYAQMPKPVVSPRFNDRNKVMSAAAEVLERCLISSFERGDVDSVMKEVRDDLILANRGVARVFYEDTKEEGKSACPSHLDRRDFLHEPARKWVEVGWSAYAFYYTEREMKARFKDKSGDAYKTATYINSRDRKNDDAIDDGSAKCKGWEVWHKVDNKVYWVVPGVDVILDESDPFLNLTGFFPSPKAAYGTLRRRTLLPIPDYTRFEKVLGQINTLTARVYGLLKQVRMRGVIPATGDVAKAVAILMDNQTDDMLLIPVPQAAFASTGGSQGFISWIPIAELANAIQGLLQSRGQLIEDFYQLSGVSDIMRGDTEAVETLGAQRLKQQNGSMRVRDKIDELQRFARDLARIEGEIIAEKFPLKDMLEMAGMEFPHKAALKRSINEAQENAKAELEKIVEEAEAKAKEMEASGQPIPPEAQQQMQEEVQKAQQDVLKKYQPILNDLAQAVSFEDIEELLKNNKARIFAIDIETDSTILKDEAQEKASRNEFGAAFAQATASLQPLLGAGEAGKKLAGEMLKFMIAPYRVGRTMDAAIDDFVEQGMAAPEGDGGQQAALDQAMVAANNKLAEAEQIKAQASMQNVQAKAMKDQAENERKMMELQQKAQENERKAGLEIAALQETVKKTKAEVDKIYAEIASMRVKDGVSVATVQINKQKADDATASTAAGIEGQVFDQSMREREPSALDIERERALLKGNQDATTPRP